MVKLSQAKELKDTARRMLAEVGVLITDAEYDSMDVADFGHDNCLVEGGQMVTVDAPVDVIPVFAREGAEVLALF